MNVLIIGGKGQLGQTLAQTVPDHIHVTSLDLPEFDITNPENVVTVVGKEKPDLIINASAYTAVDRAEEEPDLAFAVNAIGPENLAAASKKIDSRLIHISTDYVFDGTACTPYSPEAPCNPLGVYGKSKREGEIRILSVLETAVIVRTAWLYSRHANNFALTILRLLKERQALNVVADQVGTPTWATTLATAIWKIVSHKEIKGILHWTDAGVTSWYDFAVAIMEESLDRGLIETPIPIHPITTAEYPTPAARPSYSVLDCAASRRAIGAEALQWRVALREMLDVMTTV